MCTVSVWNTGYIINKLRFTHSTSLLLSVSILSVSTLSVSILSVRIHTNEEHQSSRHHTPEYREDQLVRRDVLLIEVTEDWHAEALEDVVSVE